MKSTSHFLLVIVFFVTALILTFVLSLSDTVSAQSNYQISVVPTATWTPSPTNIPLIVGNIAGPVAPVQIDTSISFTAVFTEPSIFDSHTAIFDWGDGQLCDTDVNSECSLVQNTGSGDVSGYHTYTQCGIYDVELKVLDSKGEWDTSVFEMLVVYDTSAGFVTGGGWINSPQGAYLANPLLTGRATFGFVSKYKKGANRPTGRTEFQFQVADLNFHSDTYDWLVVNQDGANAQFKGSGKINGENAPNGELYKFMIWAGDNTPDTFRIKIWWEDNNSDIVIYDNGFDQTIGGGSIVIHVSKKSKVNK